MRHYEKSCIIITLKLSSRKQLEVTKPHYIRQNLLCKPTFIEGLLPLPNISLYARVTDIIALVIGVWMHYFIFYISNSYRYNYHVLTKEGFTFLAIADQDFPMRISFAFLEKVAFSGKYFIHMITLSELCLLQPLHMITDDVYCYLNNSLISEMLRCCSTLIYSNPVFDRLRLEEGGGWV